MKQLDGTAMVTAGECIYVMIYYATHETMSLLAKYVHHLLFHGRHIDDGLDLCNDCGVPLA